MVTRAAPPDIEIIGILSDLHVAIIDRRTLDLCQQWVRDVKPNRLLLNGDTFDLGELSRYPKGMNRITLAADEIREGVKLVNWFAKYVPHITLNYGNHEARWEKLIGGDDARKFEGAIGLTLKEQCSFQGLNPDVRWARESAENPAIRLCAGVWARHGDKQSGRFGGAVNIASNRLNKNQGESEVVGHHHRAQLMYRSSFDRTSFVMALPTMARAEDYAPNADWQRGWAALTIVRTPKAALSVQPSLIVPSAAGVASWGGQVWRARV